jgi:hypothetical protein
MQSLEELREEREKRKEKASTNPRNEVRRRLDAKWPNKLKIKISQNTKILLNQKMSSM